MIDHNARITIGFQDNSHLALGGAKRGRQLGAIFYMGSARRVSLVCREFMIAMIAEACERPWEVRGYDFEAEFASIKGSAVDV